MKKDAKMPSNTPTLPSLKDREEFLTYAIRQLSSSIEYKKTLDNIAKIIVPQIADWFTIETVENGLLELVVIEHRDQKQVKWAKDFRKRQPVNLDAESGAPLVIRSGKPLFYPSINEDMLLKTAKNDEVREIIKKIGFVSAMIVPLVILGKPFGVISFITTKESHYQYTQKDFEFAQELAAPISFALGNARLLKESQEAQLRFKDLFNGISDGVLIFDMDGRYIDANPAATALLGYSLDEIKCMRVGDFLADSIAHTKDNFNQLKRLGTWRAEGTIKRKDGQLRFVEGRSEKIDTATGPIFTSVIRDISDRKKTDELNLKLAAIVESSDDAIYGKDLTGTIISWNKGAQKIFGYTSKEIIGKKVQTLIPPNRASEEDLILSRIRVGKNIDHFVTKRLRKDGTIIDCAVTVSPMKIDKKIVGASTIARDITEQMQMERRKDEFLSVASHELKTPLTSIKAFSQIIQKYFSDTSDNKSAYYISKMNTQIDRLTKLVQDLLDVSKIQSGKLSYTEDVFEVDELVREVVEDMQLITHKHKIEIEGKANVLILADKYRIGQVLTNLISNAIKYSPHADSITVKISFNSNEVTVGVKDHGIGIPEEKKEKIFQRFYRVDDKKHESFPGLGLGLYISHEIITRQGGKMWVESEVGKGSIFYFCIPIPLHAKKLENGPI